MNDKLSKLFDVSRSIFARLAILDMIQKFWNHAHIKQQRLEDMASKLDSLKNIDGLF